MPADLPRGGIFPLVLVDLPADMRKSKRASWPTASRRAARRPIGAARRSPGYQRLHQLVRRGSRHERRLFRLRRPRQLQNDALENTTIFYPYAQEACRDLDVEGTFNGKQVLSAIQGKILAQASVTGMYTLNPALAPKRIGTTSAV